MMMNGIFVEGAVIIVDMACVVDVIIVNVVVVDVVVSQGDGVSINTSRRV